MFLWTIQSIIISIVLIFLVHHLIYFFKSTLTVPKIKDLVNDPKHKYHAIYQTISGSGSGSLYTSNSTTNIDSSIKSELSSMKNDLKNFLLEIQPHLLTHRWFFLTFDLQYFLINLDSVKNITY